MTESDWLDCLRLIAHTINADWPACDRNLHSRVEITLHSVERLTTATEFSRPAGQSHFVPWSGSMAAWAPGLVSDYCYCLKCHKTRCIVTSISQSLSNVVYKRFLLHMTATCLSRIVLKCGLHRSTPPPHILPEVTYTKDEGVASSLY